MSKRLIICFLIIIANVLAFFIISFNMDILKKQELIEVYINGGEVNNTEILGVLEIPSINLKNSFYSLDSKENDVAKNVMLMDSSSMPDIENGNLILASHRGNSKVSYFNNLVNLKENDEIKVYYNKKIYLYKFNNSYDIIKSGIAKIVREKYKTTITLITCKKGSNKQTIFIGYLDKVLDM